MKQHKLLIFTKMNFGITANGGIKKKVMAQAKAFRQHGFKTDLLFFENETIKIEGDSAQIEYHQPHKWSFLKYLYGGYLKHIDISEYDYIYVRHFMTNPLFLWMLWRIKKRQPNIKIFMEIPTFPYRFEFATMPFIKRLELWIDDRCTPFFKYYLDRIVTFSSQPMIFGLPTIRTDNGIDIEQFSMLEKAPFDGQNLHLLGLANVQRWHGLDRFVEGIKNYKGNLNIFFHIVGSGDQIAHLKKMVEDYDLSGVVQFHGFLSGNALDAMFRQCHLGIGSCGMHRINVAKGETSALKSREYAARGLPFVIGYEDQGFPKTYPFLLEVTADESPIDIATLVAFYEKVRQTPDYNQQMHQYAKDHLTWKAKMEVVVKAFLSR